MKLISRTFSGTALASAWMQGRESAGALFSGDPRSVDAFRAQADAIAARFEPADRALAAGALRGGGDGAGDRLADWVDRGGFVVTTGQQPGLFGGPLYCLYKGLTAAALAKRIEEVLDVPVIPIYWVASEDHGWDDARMCTVLDAGNDIQRIGLPAIEDAGDRPLQRIPLGPEIEETVDQFAAALPSTEFSEAWVDLLRRTHRADSTIGEAQQETLASLTGPAGLFFVQAHEPSLKQKALPHLLRELEESGERESALARRADEIREAGFELQVPILEGGTNLFLESEHGRERVFRENDGFRLRGSDRRLSMADIRSIVADDPSLLSPNVLLRPVVESLLFPALCYVAGPGEAAYLPQAQPMFTEHGISQPLVHPRATLTVVEGKVEKVLDKYGLVVDDLAAPAHEIAGRLAREEIPQELASALSELRRHLGDGSESLKSAIAAMDPTLGKTVDSFRNQSLANLGDVERKVVQSLKKANEIALRQVEKAKVNLYPGGTPQERVLNPFHYLVRYDRPFVEAAAEAARVAVLP